MFKVYCHINVEAGDMSPILMKIINTQGVTEAHKVLGVYDIIAEIEGDDLRTIIEVVMEEIRQIEGIRATTTSICVDW
ncbi:MAG: Lrp/AsnC ligand binding domain-containing protein [Promethearchaeota archaeon]